MKPSLLQRSFNLLTMHKLIPLILVAIVPSLALAQSPTWVTVPAFAATVQFPEAPTELSNTDQTAYRLRLSDSTATLVVTAIDLSKQGITAEQLEALLEQPAQVEAYAKSIASQLGGATLRSHRLIKVAGLPGIESVIDRVDAGKTQTVYQHITFLGTVNYLMTFNARSPKADLKVRDAFFGSFKLK
jgi:hypothetical protein